MPALTGQFGTLEADKGYFLRKKSLETDEANDALAEADEEVMRIFADWDFSSWTTSEPKSIALLASKYASGAYMERVYPGKGDDSRGARLKREAIKSLEGIRENKGPRLADNSIQGPLETATGDTSGLTAEIEIG